MQGEGALEGGYAHYRMRAQHEHDFRFSRFNSQARRAAAVGTSCRDAVRRHE